MCFKGLQLCPGVFISGDYVRGGSFLCRETYLFVNKNFNVFNFKADSTKWNYLRKTYHLSESVTGTKTIRHIKKRPMCKLRRRRKNRAWASC